LISKAEFGSATCLGPFHDLDDEPPPARAPFWRPLLRRALIVLVIYAVMTAVALLVVGLAPSAPFLP
jgi:hypothetical protein